VLVDALGNPLRFILTSGAAGDNPQALPLLAGQRPQEVLADRGYDADATITSIEQELHATATIPSRRRRTTPRTRLRGVPRTASGGVLHRQTQVLPLGVLPLR
jgi:transposase